MMMIPPLSSENALPSSVQESFSSARYSFFDSSKYASKVCFLSPMLLVGQQPTKVLYTSSLKVQACL